MQEKILIAPAGPSMSSNRYGKEFYYLKHLSEASPDTQFKAFVKNITDVPTQQNVSVEALKPDRSRTRFRIELFKQTYKEINMKEPDILHHMKLSFNSFNPIIAGGLADEVPTLIGPAYPPHMVDKEAVRNFINKLTGMKWSQKTVDRWRPFIDETNGSIKYFRNKLFAQTLVKADKIIVIDKATKKMYEKFVPEYKLEVLPFGVAVDRFKIGKPSKSNDIVAIGTQLYRKGFDILLEAWERIANKYPDSTLQIYGNGPLLEDNVNHASNLGILDSVYFNGNVKHAIIREQLANARAFVHPTRSEAQAHVRLEAMASGCPVIASNIRGTTEMIRDGTDGLVVSKNSPQELANAVATVLDKPNKSDMMGERARQRAEDKYSWTTLAPKFAEIYDSLL